MGVTVVSDATERYLERVAEDCELLLGAGIELQDVEIDDEGDVITLRVSYELAAASWTSEGRGGTLVAAHAALRDQLVLDRIRLGVRALYRRHVK